MTYVIARNGGYEGHSPPLLAIADRETAIVALEFMKASGESGFELFEVPEWPAAPNKWWDTKPLPPHVREPEPEDDRLNDACARGVHIPGITE